MPLSGDFAKLKKIVKAFGPAGMRQVAGELSRKLSLEAVADVASEFAEQRDPQGRSWTEVRRRRRRGRTLSSSDIASWFSDSGKARRRALGPLRRRPGRFLVKTGTLERSFRPKPLAAGISLGVTTAVAYAKFHAARLVPRYGKLTPVWQAAARRAGLRFLEQHFGALK